METSNNHDTAKLCVVIAWISSYLIGFLLLRNTKPVNILIMIWVVTVLGLVSFIFCQSDTDE